MDSAHINNETGNSTMPDEPLRKLAAKTYYQRLPSSTLHYRGTNDTNSHQNCKY